MSSSSPISTLDQLKRTYEEKADKAERYASANLVDSWMADADYIKLLIEREEARYDLKKAEVNDDYYFNYRFAPVMKNRIQQLRNRLSTLGGAL